MQDGDQDNEEGVSALIWVGEPEFPEGISSPLSDLSNMEFINNVYRNLSYYKNYTSSKPLELQREFETNFHRVIVPTTGFCFLCRFVSFLLNLETLKDYVNNYFSYYWWEFTPWNAHKKYKNSPQFWNIV